MARWIGGFRFFASASPKKDAFNRIAKIASGWEGLDPSQVWIASPFCRFHALGYGEEETSNGVDSGPLFAYHELVKSRRLKGNDPRQEAAALRLQQLYDSLVRQKKFGLFFKRNNWQNLLSSINSLTPPTFLSSSNPSPSSTLSMSNLQKGLYLFGSPGRGKTLLMDLFFQSLPSSKKLRTHFHKFMLDIHARLHSLQKNNTERMAYVHFFKPFLFQSFDPMDTIAFQISEEFDVICLDEVEVVDIADALILLRLFSCLWKNHHGFGNRSPIFIFTSNLHPDLLYYKGLNRNLFLPFIDLLKTNCDLIDLNDMEVGDYRKMKSLVLQNMFLFPINARSQKIMDRTFLDLTGVSKGQRIEIECAFHRSITLYDASGKVSRFHFDDICGGNHGSPDYLAIANHFNVIFVEGIPWLGDPLLNNEARRMITLIDVVYEKRGLMICSAFVPLKSLFSTSPPTTLLPNESDQSPPLVQQQPNPSDGIHEKGNDFIDEEILQIMMEKPGNSKSEMEDTILSVVDVGGSSGRSTTMIKGNMEWSATGLNHASLAMLSNSSFFAKVAFARAHSRILQMQTLEYVINSTAELTIRHKLVMDHNPPG